MAISKWSLAFGIGALGFLGCGGADWVEAAQESETSEESAAATVSKSYLSLGNSIAYGYDPTNGTPNVPSSFVGYPEYVASKGHKVTNASCPGETSSSFFSTAEPDNGCRDFKAAFSLHADYETTQSVFAVAAVGKKTYDFITLDIGANDLFLLQKTCLGDPVCIQGKMTALITTYTQNLQKGYNQLKTAGATGKFIGLTTYAMNYNDPLAVGALTAINTALVNFAKQIDGKIADGYGIFKTKSAASGGDACAAGLLIKLPNGTCDIHPSKKGREALGDAILNPKRPEDIKF